MMGLVNRRGEVLAQSWLSTKGYETPELFIQAIKDRLDPVIAEFGRENISGIGIGAPNANYYTGEIVMAANLRWKEVIPLRRLVEAAFGLPVTITNDAKATAIGEMTYGAAKGMKDFIIVTLGTGVGGGFVVNGQLIYGHDGFAGELGHVIAVRGGRQCGCGRKGCLETYTSATGIVRTATEILEQLQSEQQLAAQKDWLISVWEDKGSISSSEIHKAALAGDPVAIEVFELTGKMLGEILADMVAITSPEAIIFFGGLAKAGAFILEPVRRHMEENLLAVFRNKVNIILSGLEECDAAILGAAALSW